jgi:hypothetical protein
MKERWLLFPMQVVVRMSPEFLGARSDIGDGPDHYAAVAGGDPIPSRMNQRSCAFTRSLEAQSIEAKSSWEIFSLFRLRGLWAV